jgi:hypothetical protein|tara:strand:- start:303 stop:464 length:162 start_codon:yes stop_codon:yes gene_type:complete
MGMTDDYDQSLDSYLSYYVAIEAMRVAYVEAQKVEKQPSVFDYLKDENGWENG